MKMNDEIKSKIQEHINEACRAHMEGYANWLYDEFVENNELSKFNSEGELIEALDQFKDAIRNVGWGANNVDYSTKEPIIKDTIEWAKGSLGVELDWDYIEDCYFPICHYGEWVETIDEVRERVVVRWFESYPTPTARELVKKFKDIGEKGRYDTIWISKYVGGDDEWAYKKMRYWGDLLDEGFFGYGYGIHIVEVHNKALVLRLCKMKKTNITTKVIEAMLKSLLKITI